MTVLTIVAMTLLFKMKRRTCESCDDGQVYLDETLQQLIHAMIVKYFDTIINNNITSKYGMKRLQLKNVKIAKFFFVSSISPSLSSS